MNNEPDFILPFRYFSYFWLVFSLLLLLLPLVVLPGAAFSTLHASLYVVHALLLMVYLQLPVLPDVFARGYLPLALVIAVGGVLLIPFVPKPDAAGSQSELLFASVIGTMRHTAMLIVSAVLVGARFRLRWMLLYTIALCTLLTFTYTMLSPPSTPSARLYSGIFYLALGFIMATVGFLTWQLSQAEQQRRRALEEAHAKLARHASTLEELTISRERNRMARELHDTLAHTLSGLAVQLETARVYARSDVDLSNRLLEESIAATRSGLHETRRALQSLRASPLHDLGLALALEELAKSAQARTGVQLALDLPNEPLALNSPVEQCIYRIAQEAIANVVKHAAARTLAVRLSNSDALRLEICDDGMGFDAGEVTQLGHYGIMGMRERAAVVNGSLAVRSQIGRGTNVILII